MKKVAHKLDVPLVRFKKIRNRKVFNETDSIEKQIISKQANLKQVEQIDQFEQIRIFMAIQRKQTKKIEKFLTKRLTNLFS